MKSGDDRSQRDSGQPGGGVGRREKVEKSGVYPATGASVPQDAVVRTVGEWGQGAGGEEGGRSELHFTEEELRRARESGSGEGASEEGGGSREDSRNE